MSRPDVPIPAMRRNARPEVGRFADGGAAFIAPTGNFPLRSRLAPVNDVEATC